MSGDAEEIRRAFHAYCEDGIGPRLTTSARVYLRAIVADARDRGDALFLAGLADEMHGRQGGDHIGPFIAEALGEGSP